MMPMFLIEMLAPVALLLVLTIYVLTKRVVVPTNQVHIVQSGSRTTSYGAVQTGSKNTYYNWPPYLPGIGVKVSVLPLSIFRVELSNYAAYDQGRLPFELDVLAFFRVKDTNIAATRVSSIKELDDQLQGIMQGVVRTVLANAEIEAILGKRAEFSEAFTKEVVEQLPQWGIEAVKNVELMDIRDAEDSHVIHNIMAKKKSDIEKESRITVANNMQLAQTKEIEADQLVQVRKQDALEAVGIRTAQKDQMVGIQNQQAQQAVAVEAKNTATKNMDVQQVNNVRAAEIDRDVKVVEADRDKQVLIVNAEAIKQKAITEADGTMQAAKLEAQGIEAKGKAEGAAQTAILMAPVTTQVELADKIGANESYQKYLVTIRNVEKEQAVGVEMAKTMTQAEIKIIVNSGSVNNGIESLRDVMSSKGGAAVGAFVEGFKNTTNGDEIIAAIKEVADKVQTNGSHPA